jgi:hypothetical protein
MKRYVIGTALLAFILSFAGGASAQERNDGRDVATVIGLYVEQAPGVLADEKLVRGHGGQRWAEVRRVGAGVKESGELVRIPAGVALRNGDRVLVAGRSEASASVGASAAPRAPMEPMLERPLDISGLRAPITRPLSVVPGSCIPF